MAKRTRSSASKLPTLAKKYERISQSIDSDERERRLIMTKVYDIATSKSDCYLEIHEHVLGPGKHRHTTEHFKLTDPKAALIHLERFCNIWLPMPWPVCIKLGCLPVMFRPGPPPLVCFLTHCLINVCPDGSPGNKVHCYGICIPPSYL